jgi:hypothetical protein
MFGTLDEESVRVLTGIGAAILIGLSTRPEAAEDFRLKFQDEPTWLLFG